MKITLTFTFLFLGFSCFSQEICNNGIDDDGDGFTDLEDIECACSGIVETPLSLIGNPSFENYVGGNPAMANSSFSIRNNLVPPWTNANDFSLPGYYHTAGTIPPWLQNGNLQPFPDGNAGAVIQWQTANGMPEGYGYHIIAQCLNTPLVAGTSYTLQFSAGIVNFFPGSFPYDGTVDSLELVLYGTQFCANIPIAQQNCPQQLTALTSGFVTVDTNYHLLTLTFTPSTNIKAIVISAPCDLPPEFSTPTSTGVLVLGVIDNLILNKTELFQPPQLISQTGLLCTDNLVLAAAIDTTGGTWQWYKDSIALVGQTGATLNVSALGLGAGDYQVVYTLPTICSSSSYTVILTVPPVVTATSNPSGACPGGSVTLTASGADSYVWSPSAGLSTVTGNTVSASPAVTTVYTVTGTTTIGCFSDTTVTAVIFSEPVISVNDTLACKGEPVTLTASGAVSYSWTPSEGLSSTTGATVTAQSDETIIYTVTGTDGNNCTSTAESTLEISGFSVKATASPYKTIVTEPVTITAQPAGNSFTWYFENGEVLSGEQVSFKSDDPGSYTFSLVGVNELGCRDSINFTLNVDAPPLFYVPNAFTPDGDEYNNTFQPVFTYGFDPYNFEMLVFNRWGETIFESHDAKAGWDGTYHGQLVEDGSYTWAIVFKDPQTDSRTEIKGSVTVIK